MTGAPELLPIDRIDPHPDNPRIVRRDDVIGQIAAEIADHGFGAEHAILVRPKGDRYEVISGHNRRDAAIKAGITEIPAWVRDMDDDEAFWQLRLANSQGELSAVEEGRHIRTYVERGERGGRGKTGGLREYARKLRIADDDAPGETSLRERVRADAVLAAYETARTSAQFSSSNPPPPFQTLYALGAAPPWAWKELVHRSIAGDWVQHQAAEYARSLTAFEKAAGEWRGWLRPWDLFEESLGGRFTVDTVNRLVVAAEAVVAWIDEKGWDPDDQHDAFVKWLEAGPVYDRRKIGAYKAGLIAEKRERDTEAARLEEEAARAAYDAPGWHLGRWQDHVDKVEDGSVKVLLTDPPYGMDYQSDWRLDRSKPHKHDKIEGDDEDAATLVRDMAEAFLPKLADDAHVFVFCGWRNEPEMRAALEQAGLTIRGSLIWDKQGTGMGDPNTTFAPAHERILHFVKGSPILYTRVADVLRHPRSDSSRHPTEKPVPLLIELIEATTVAGELVADPFGGVASTAVAATKTDRLRWSVELREDYVEIGVERLRALDLDGDEAAAA